MTRREFVGATIGAAAWQLTSARGWAAAANPGITEPTILTLSEAAAAIRERTVTSVQLTEACLARIGIYDSKLGTFITIMREQALAQARDRDTETAAGKSRGPLHGIPLALKDNIDTAGTRTTAGSAVFASRVPTEDSVVVARLLAAGAVIIGKTNLYEFAWGGISFFGPARNPWALDRIPGGSSSGTAAAVSAGLCFGALGTDTGGSVRQPDAYCNLVGLKPTNGLVSLRGIIPGVLSLDTCGPLTRTVEDTALMLNAIAGYDRLDITSVDRPKEDYVAALQQPVKGLRIGLPTGYFDRLDPEIQRATNEALAVLAKLTRSTREMTLPPTAPAGMDGGGSGVSAELYAYHEEFARRDLGKYMLPERRRLESLVGTHGGDAADYVRGQWALQRLRRTIDDTFQDFDLAVMPTERDLQPKLNDYIKGTYDTTPRDPGTSFANCPPINVYGIPAISIPCGFSRDGLPIGLMIAGPNFSEGRILALAQAYERETGWTQRRPALSPDMPVPKVDFPRE